MVGYGLFWAVMAFALRAEPPGERVRLLRIAQQSRWPPLSGLGKARLRLTDLGWVFWALLLVSGFAALALRGIGWEQITADAASGERSQTLLLIKGLLVILLAVAQAVFTARPARWAIHLGGFTTLAIVIVSVLVSR